MKSGDLSEIILEGLEKLKSPGTQGTHSTCSTILTPNKNMGFKCVYSMEVAIIWVLRVNLHTSLCFDLFLYYNLF